MLNVRVENIGDSSTGPQWVPSSAPMTSTPQPNPIDAAEKWLLKNAHGNARKATVTHYTPDGREFQTDLSLRGRGQRRVWGMGDTREVE